MNESLNVIGSILFSLALCWIFFLFSSLIWCIYIVIKLRDKYK